MGSFVNIPKPVPALIKNIGGFGGRECRGGSLFKGFGPLETAVGCGV